MASTGFLLAVSMVSGQTQDKKTVEPVEYKSDYYPLHVGDQWRYLATVSDASRQDTEKKDQKADGTQKVTVTVDQKEPYEYRLDKKEKSEVVWRYRLKVTSGSKEYTEFVGLLKDGAYRYATANKEITPPLHILNLPFKQGDSWSVQSVTAGEIVSGTFKSEEDTVKVPAGSFQAIHVTAESFAIGSKKMSMDFWFARDHGLVKETVRVGNIVTALDLEEFKPARK